MINEKLIKKMIDNNRVYLNKYELFWHYSAVYFIMFIPLFDVIYTIKNDESFLKFNYSYLLILVAIIMFFIQKNKLNFKHLKFFNLSDNFDIAINTTVQELNWVIDYTSDNYIRAHRGFDYKSGGSWGEMITIIKLENRILINSICDPNGLFSSVISYGWNRKNIKIFEENLVSTRNTPKTQKDSKLGLL